jgi:hypothetical protein
LRSGIHSPHDLPRARFDRLERKLDALAVQLADQRRMPAG